MLKAPSWEGVGSVMEVRGLGTKADANKIWAHEVKLQCWGQTLAIQTKNAELVKDLKVGDTITAVGGFDPGNGNLRLTLTAWKPFKAA